jgi:PAS domain S-box-containing protein
MPVTRSQAESYLDAAVDAVAGGGAFASVLDRIPVPVYVTDAEGNVTYWNRACVEFAGREPALGHDKWCVTWRIHKGSGEHLPHERCPMAVAIQRREPVRGEVAIAMRPDGSRRAFSPYPTPLIDADGELKGAVNLLLDVSGEQASLLADQASRCRRLATATVDRRAASILAAMAAGFDDNARALAGLA